MVRKFLQGLNILFLLLIIISTFCSCTGEMNMLDGNNNEQINFSVFVPEWKNTDSLSRCKTSRATPITDASLSTSNTFDLIADQNDGTGNYCTFIDKEAVSFTNSIWQTTSSNYYWSGIANKTVNFYAYYPTSISGNISHTTGSAPTLLYTVSDDVTSQIDIIAATSNSVPGSTTSSTPLIFNHIFSAVKFSVGASGLPSGTIKSISISGIHNSGTYTFGSGWSNVKGSNTFVISPSTVITGTSGVSITSDTYTLMMIPQIFSNATISLVYSNGTTFSTTISGTWNAGGVYTYNLSKTIVRNYDYTGAAQTFTAPYTGTYKIECWGAQGGTISNQNFPYPDGGLGGYTSGNIYLLSGTVLYIYVGQKGSLLNEMYRTYNGGGMGAANDGACSSGGGETDIRIIGGEFGEFNSIKSRIMVAGGGGGCERSYLAGAAGGLVAYNSNNTSINNFIVNQTNGYRLCFGENADLSITASGAGGGYQGGVTGDAIGMGTLYLGSTGGSSFISGHNGCNAINYDKTITGTRTVNSLNETYDICSFTGQSILYINGVPYVFNNTKMIDGQGFNWTDTKGTLYGMPSPTGGTETGHSGNGYARITFVSAN
ncbi:MULTISPECIES: fimbrillin family protein [Prevotella]|uniref:receptor protein-tyrosine kinase n=1 Tax=Prevotella herbatica TaxID=2801997 RepID=A0ABM7NZ84_9BACT|nr:MULTISPECIES: fimbrillin family protein [Prevotella]MDN5554203.1 fimbrillin family protein [Prevotella sp.]BCS85844.1 fimbrillin family protein [Prevotella herbatica]